MEIKKKHPARLLTLVAFLAGMALATACGAQPTPGPSLLAAGGDSGPLPALEGPATVTGDWWNDAVFYEVFVRSFYDSDGDGIGDLPGLIARLDYLNDGDPNTVSDLGVTGIWLMPVMQSPSYHGYDATDYYMVEEDYGDNEAFRRLIQEAHARGIRVIVDLMLNHTSDRHPWFLEAAGSPASPRRDWYVWRDRDPGWLSPWGTSTWYRAGDQFYYGLFWEGMPDLNYDNPAVTEEMMAVTRFWLEDMDADGLRLDAIRHLFEEDGRLDGLPQTHAWLRAYDEQVDQMGPDKLTVGEVWDTTPVMAAYVTDGEVDITFEFALAEAILRSVDDGDPYPLAVQLQQVLASYPPGQYAPFLTNHDQNRVMTQLGGDEDKARLAASILLTLPGVPFVYYGEEIGMTGQKPDELIRTPMQWSAGAGAGFTTGTPWEAINRGYQEVNVASQAADSGSLLSHYRRLIQVRNEYVALRRGGLTSVVSACRPVYGYLRHFPGSSQDGADREAILVLHNFSGESQAGCRLDLEVSPLGPGLYGVQDLLGGQAVADLPVDDRGGFSAYLPVEELRPQQSLVVLLQAH